MKQGPWEIFLLALFLLLVIGIVFGVGGLLENLFTGSIGEL